MYAIRSYYGPLEALRESDLVPADLAVSLFPEKPAENPALTRGLERARRERIANREMVASYGLDPEAEVRLLRVVHELAHALWAELSISPTLLAHAVPPDRLGHTRDDTERKDLIRVNFEHAAPDFRALAPVRNNFV